MAIIVSKNGMGARKIVQAPIEGEDYLQRYVSDNPDSLPLDEIKDGVKLLVIGREFSTDSGPIDVLAVDGEGEIYIVETKLYKNPDKRHVIAQMLDYGAALWKAYGGGEGFLSDIDEMLSESGAGGLSQRLQKEYDLDDQEVANVRDQMRANLSDGNIRFVVLMDRLHDRLRDLILFINQKSRFNIYAVELEFYKHDGMEIVIPRLFGSEVKKEVSSGGGGRRRLGSEADFFDAVEEPSAKGVFRRLLDYANRIGATFYFGASGISIKLPDPNGTKQGVTLFVINKYGELYIGWSSQQLETLELPTNLGSEYASSVAALFPGVTPNPKNHDALSRSLTADEVDKSFARFTSVVDAFIDKIKKASVARRKAR